MAILNTDIIECKAINAGDKRIVQLANWPKVSESILVLFVAYFQDKSCLFVHVSAGKN